MVSKSKPVASNRFQTAATTTERLGTCNLAPDLYDAGSDQYGRHFRRVLPDGQYIDYTITKAGMVIEKINFVPSKDRRDGNGAYGNRWLGILEYRRSDDHAADFAVFSQNGMSMTPPAKAGTAAVSGKFIPVTR